VSRLATPEETNLEVDRNVEGYCETVQYRDRFRVSGSISIIESNARFSATNLNVLWRMWECKKKRKKLRVWRNKIPLSATNAEA
jgi:hypothetical protein